MWFIMKKWILLSVVLLVFCFLAGCDNTKFEDEFVALYQEEWKITCNINYQDEAWWSFDSVLYIDGDNVYQEAEVIEEWESIKIYGLTVDGMNYSRWDLYWDGKGFLVESEQSVEQLLEAYEMEAEAEDVNITCVAGLEWSNFAIPSDIEFADLSELVK